MHVNIYMYMCTRNVHMNIHVCLHIHMDSIRGKVTRTYAPVLTQGNFDPGAIVDEYKLNRMCIYIEYICIR